MEVGQKGQKDGEQPTRAAGSAYRNYLLTEDTSSAQSERYEASGSRGILAMSIWLLGTAQLLTASTVVLFTNPPHSSCG
jgi:hypothetical protein